MFRIWLFGSMSIAMDEDSDAAMAVSGRCASLLAYLALGQGRSFSRSELLGNLWPEHASSGTSGSFNTALWRLRRLIERPPLKPGDLIVCDRHGTVGLTGPAGVWLDVNEFEQLISAGLSKPPERLSDADIDALRRGVALYKADILLDVTDDWALREREKHRRNYLNALWRLMQLATIRRDYADAIGHAQCIVDNDALREDVHRELMQLFVLNGQRAQALRQFEHCRDLLRRELAIQPMRETMALYQEITNSAIGGVPGEPAPAPLSALRLLPDLVPVHFDDQHPHGLINTARQHLALADSQLQMSLLLFESMAHRTP